MHKDQDRIRTALLPFLVGHTLEKSPEAERDCTVLNRAFLQGPDPLLIMELCPEEFKVLCKCLGLSVESGQDAIEQAHWRGPGILLAGGTGLPHGFVDACGGDVSGFSLAWRQEALWLVLASLSDTTEEDYKSSVTVLERLRRVVTAGQRLTTLLERRGSPWNTAETALRDFAAATKFELNASDIPCTDQDVGFYLAYKAGHHVAGVRHGDKVFYGCMPGVTLDQVGVKVDEKVSESYGFVRNTPK